MDQAGLRGPSMRAERVARGMTRPCRSPFQASRHDSTVQIPVPGVHGLDRPVHTVKRHPEEKVGRGVGVRKPHRVKGRPGRGSVLSALKRVSR